MDIRIVAIDCIESTAADLVLARRSLTTDSLEGSVSDRAAASALLRVVAAASDQRFAAKSIISASDTTAGDIDSTGHELIVGALVMKRIVANRSAEVQVLSAELSIDALGKRRVVAGRAADIIINAA